MFVVIHMCISPVMPVTTGTILLHPVSTWPMVAASYLPLLAVVLAHVAGASDLTAANAGLVVAIVLLTVHGWQAGRAAGLQRGKLLVATSIAAGLGLVMILLKDLVLIHLH